MKESSAEAQRKNDDELAEFRAELEAEKQKQETWKSQLERKITEALERNEQKSRDLNNDFDPVFVTDEEQEEYKEAMAKIPEGTLKGLNENEFDESDLPEEDIDIIRRYMKQGKKGSL